MYIVHSPSLHEAISCILFLYLFACLSKPILKFENSNMIEFTFKMTSNIHMFSFSIVPRFENSWLLALTGPLVVMMCLFWPKLLFQILSIYASISSFEHLCLYIVLSFHVATSCGLILIGSGWCWLMPAQGRNVPPKLLWSFLARQGKYTDPSYHLILWYYGMRCGAKNDQRNSPTTTRGTILKLL